MDLSGSDREHDTTIIAKALYDNLADAPDELSFRKGDIVTVIEQDVDGLVGWWLCILHGRQGIAPGNRLQLISENDRKNGKGSFRRGSYSTDDFSDSHDGSWTSDVSPSLNLDYDSIPSAKINRGGSYKDKLSVKELYDIPIGHGGDTLRRGLSLMQSQGLETCDLPTTLPRGTRLPKSSQGQVGQDQFNAHLPVTKELSGPRYSKPRLVQADQEIYDAPRSTNKEPIELYDVPNSRTNETVVSNTAPFDQEGQTLYDVPQHVGLPHRGRSYNISNASPPGTPKPARVTEFSHIPEPNAIGVSVKEALANYDVPRKLPHYDVPRRQTDPQELYDVPPKFNKDGEELYDVPNKDKMNPQRTGSAATLPPQFSKVVHEELYDIPTKNSVGLGKIDNVDTKNEYNEQLSRGPQEKPIYNKPLPYKGKSDPHDAKIALNNNDVEIYDTPPASGQRAMTLQNQTHQEELYDVPSRKASGVDELYDVPPSVGQHGGPTEIYDTPTKQTLIRGFHPAYGDAPHFGGRDQNPPEDVYDTPPVHDVDKVMAAAGIDEARKRLVKAAAATGNDSDDDDYVDYEDIYGREPPSYLMKAMNKTTSPQHGSPSKPHTIKRQQSVLEQINMDAVKELTINPSQALDRLAKLHLAVDTSVTTLLGFAEDDWLSPVRLQRNIAPIRDMAGKVKIALRLLTEFGLGALVNAKKIRPVGELVDSINCNVEPLVESYYKIKVCLLHLDGNNWIVPTARDAENEKFFATVNAIMILSERIPENCRKMNAIIQTNLEILFGADTSISTSDASDNPQGVRNAPVSPGNVRQDLKGKLKQLGPIDAKTVRGILDIDHRMSYQASPNIHDQRRGTLGDSNSGTLRRRQEVMTTTVPRPPVPPKPSLPNNRKSLAMEAPEPVWVKAPVSSRIETLVTEYAVESPRIKYNSDPTRSPSALEKNKDPAYGGSCPTLQNQHSPFTERGLLHAAGSEEPLPNSASQGNVGNLTTGMQEVTLVRKLPSESNIHDPELAPATPLHSRSASMPYDEKDAKFPSLEFEPPQSPGKSVSKVAKLDHRDIETLEFFLRQVEAQVMILRGAMKNLTESVEKNSIPQVFVAHSKFVILTAHKVVHAAEEVTERLIDQDVTQRIRRENVHLTDNIRAVVAATKTAALEYPSGNAMGDMIGTVVSLGESVRDIHGEAKHALSL